MCKQSKPSSCYPVSITFYVYMSHLLDNVNPVLVFDTRSGEVAVTPQGDGYVLDFPLNPPTEQVQYVVS